MAYAEHLAGLLPESPDICAICINGKFQNLDPQQAAHIVSHLRPRFAIPTHYDMMACNQADPETFRTEVQQQSPATKVHIMRYDQPFLYRKVAS
jgi:L-ascorbate metabolism protein UlaG (beta-lactamase superfamily)